ncbi:hypothetical protein N9A94_09205 [Akkermansiaceae bacterium]|nr:hypothetical protein [Akkermansiaceae bacterium]
MKRNWRPSFSLLFVCVLLLIIGLLAIPKLRKMKADANESKVRAYLSSLGIAMTEFDSQYGDFPSKLTKELLQDEGCKLPEGDTANAYLAQLLASKTIDSEKVFYVPGLDGTKEGDDVIDSPETTLARGENGYGYVIPNENGFLSAGVRSSREPVLVVPVLKGGPNPKFDRRLFQGSGLLLHLDTSVGNYPINTQSELLDSKTGKNLFHPGDDTIWGKSTTIDVKAPWFMD